jgi:hypothetical protein
MFQNVYVSLFGDMFWYNYTILRPTFTCYAKYGSKLNRRSENITSSATRPSSWIKCTKIKTEMVVASGKVKIMIKSNISLTIPLATSI